MKNRDEESLLPARITKFWTLICKCPWTASKRKFRCNQNQNVRVSNFQFKIPKFVSRRSVTPCPSSTPSCCGTTRTCSRSTPTGPLTWWTRRSCAEHRLQLICSWAEARPRFTCLLFTLYNQTTNKSFIARFAFSSHQCIIKSFVILSLKA